ncbi:MAG: cellulase family glycosylhydrolase, partial [Candidatus Calescibacterium sp.]
QIKNLGFNTIRLLISIEGVMPNSPDEINYEYIDYIRKIVEKAWEHDIYVLLDSHTDAIFSRFFIARFNDTESPIVQTLRNLLAFAGGGLGDGGQSPISFDIAGLVGALLPQKGTNNKCKGKEVNTPYNNAVRGNMWPKWAVQEILYERKEDVGGELWGYPRITLMLRKFIEQDENWQKIVNVVSKFDKNIANTLSGLKDQVKSYLEIPGVDINKLTREDIIKQTTDMLPFTNWGLNAGFSLDVQRAWAALFAGKDVFPDLKVKKGNEMVNIQEYLQSAYEKMWGEVAKAVKDMPNVIGYDIMNEPSGFFLLMTIIAAYFKTGSKEGIINLIDTIFADRKFAEDLVDILIGIGLLPDVTPETREQEMKLWGFDKANLLAILGLNYGFDRNYIMPFHERMGRAILQNDPNAIIFVEPTISSIENLLLFIVGGGEGETVYNVPYSRPELPQVVYAPHWYPDIYPFPGFNMPYRVFKVEEKRRKKKEYLTSILTHISSARKNMGNIPVILGEYGTYFTLSSKPAIIEQNEETSIWKKAVENARSENYIIPKYIINDEYEALEDIGIGRIIWCWSWENDDWRGEGWNAENFSIVERRNPKECKPVSKKARSCDDDPYIVRLDFGNETTYIVPRGYEAYARPHPNFLAGKLKSLQFFSELHYFDPEKGIPNPVGEFTLELESKETDEPTEIFIPYYIYYPDGFFVWVSDGYIIYDHKNFRLYWYHEVDDPGFIHKIVIRPPIKGKISEDWDYFVKEDVIVSRKRR